MIFPLLRPHQIPRRHKLRFSGNKIFTYTVGITLLMAEPVHCMGNPKPLHHAGGQHLIVRLLLGRTTSPLDQAPPAIDDLPLLPKPAVRCIIR